MKNSDMPAMPTYELNGQNQLEDTSYGFTKREEVLKAFMSAMLSNPEMDYNYATNGDALAKDAMKFVDSYFNELGGRLK